MPLDEVLAELRKFYVQANDRHELPVRIIITKTDLYGHGAIDQIIGDLRQEIAAGSSSTIVYTNPTTGVVSYIYRPSVVAASAPQLSGPTAYGSPNSPTSAWNATFPNLVKESVYGSAFYGSSIEWPIHFAGPVEQTSSPSEGISLLFGWQWLADQFDR